MCEYLFGLRKPCEVLPSRDRLYRPLFSVCCHSERCLTMKPYHAQQSKATRVHNLHVDGVKQAGKGGGSLCQTKSVWPSSLNKNETPMNKKEQNRVHEQVASRFIVTGLSSNFVSGQKHTEPHRQDLVCMHDHDRQKRTSKSKTSFGSSFNYMIITRQINASK